MSKAEERGNGNDCINLFGLIIHGLSIFGWGVTLDKTTASVGIRI
jgi:hypothetical protein